MTEPILFHRIPLTITLRAPWLTPGDALANGETDITLARDTEGRLTLPGTLVHGVLRGALERLGQLIQDAQDDLGGCNIESTWQRALGIGSGDAAEGKVNAFDSGGALIIPDLVCTASEEEEQGTGRGVRVTIDPDRGAAADGKILFFELPFPYGTNVKFKGDLLLRRMPDGLTPPQAVGLLERALPRIAAIGGAKSAGFGQVVSHEIGVPVPVHAAKVKAPDAALTVAYRIDRPFLVNAAKESGNIRVSDDRLSGAALKGTLAAAFRALGHEDEAFFAAMHVGDAAPVDTESGAARLVPPLSLAIAEQGQGKKLVCALTTPQGSMRWRFSDDWKGLDRPTVHKWLAKQYPGLAEITPSMRSRTRTAVDPATGGPLYEEERGGALFSEKLVDPTDRVWRGVLHSKAEGPSLDTLCGILQAGAPGFGSTGAVLTGTLEPREMPEDPKGDIVYLTLQSEARLFTEDDAMNRAQIETAYTEYFARLGLALDGFIARQGLRGGYLAIRYRANRDDSYRPWIVTEPGSVFRLRAADGGSVAEALKRHDILTQGLPHVAFDRASWRDFPFLREAGFGRVASFTALHLKLKSGKPLK